MGKISGTNPVLRLHYIPARNYIRPTLKIFVIKKSSIFELLYPGTHGIILNKVKKKNRQQLSSERFG